MEYRQMQHFPPLPKVPDIDFRPWTTYQHVVELYGNPPNDPAQAWADWISKLVQEHPWAPQGRGSNLHAAHKPLMPRPKGQSWKKGKPAFGEQLRARFHLALQQPDTCTTGPIRGFTGKPTSIGWELPPRDSSLTRVTIGTDTETRMQAN